MPERGTDITPDLHSIRKRGLRLRRNRQIGSSLVAVALVAGGGVAALNLLRPVGEMTIISAGEGEVPGDGAAEQPDPTDPVQDGGSNDDTDGAVDPTPDSVEDGIGDGDEVAEVTPVDGDGSSDGDATYESESSPARPSPSSLSDGSGGWLTVTPDGVAHLRADNSSSLLDFADPAGGFAQRWPTDVVTIDGGHYLLVDQFVNREDLAAEREWALAESYGIAYDSETGAVGLDQVATPEELDALNHWEVSILAIDLATDEIITVENRIINNTHSPDWFYNGHITSDGSVILVMRELWQGHCLYAEGLTVDGQPVDIADAAIYPKPQRVATMSFDEIDAVFGFQADPPQPCRTLDDLPDSGLGVWGTQADRAQIEAFRTAFFEAGLG